MTTHKGVNVPGVPVAIPSLTRKDVDDLEFALDLGVDFVALSFVRSAADVRDLRSLIDQAGSEAHVIAKIEKAEAVDSLDAILIETDAVMVARGDLGVEIGVATLPLIQKRIILASLQRGKPVITATQMLETMVHQPEPTRAEASDVANAILDGTSALMLSGETAVGEYPVEAVSYMDQIAKAVEPALGYRHQLPEPGDNPTVGQAMSNAACDLAEALGAKALLVPTFTGGTASAVARLRPHRPIVALTHHLRSVTQLAIEWGVTPILIRECVDVEDLWNESLNAARQAGLVESGDLVVITAGTAVNMPGSTNVIKVDTRLARLRRAASRRNGFRPALSRCSRPPPSGNRTEEIRMRGCRFRAKTSRRRQDADPSARTPTPRWPSGASSSANAFRAGGFSSAGSSWPCSGSSHSSTTNRSGATSTRMTRSSSAPPRWSRCVRRNAPSSAGSRKRTRRRPSRARLGVSAT